MSENLNGINENVNEVNENPCNSVQNQVQPKKTNGAALASLICACIALFINPLYLVVIAAIVLAIVGLSSSNPNGKGIWQRRGSL